MEDSKTEAMSVPRASLRYLESPFILDDPDTQGLPALRRLPMPPPLFYPQAIDLFLWIDESQRNIPSLQDLIDQPDLADEIFPKKMIKALVPDPLTLRNTPYVNLSEPDESTPKDDLDLFVARISEEASASMNEENLKERMRSNPLSEEALISGIAFLESLRNGDDETPSDPVEPTLRQPPSLPAVVAAEGLPETLSSFPPQSIPSPSPSVSVANELASESTATPSESIPSTEAILHMAAKVPLPDGSQRPAFASQFFLTTRQLEDLLTEAIPYPAAAKDVRQLIRLWAESEKRAGSQGVKLALDVKSVLIKAQVTKFDTDLKGEAEVAGLKPDDYYLIGIDKDDQTGIVTIWSKPVAIGRGENRVELSLQDIVWNK
ncbi:MAG: hypothetical protein VB980_00800 [Opitutales bacterium]